MAPPRFLNTSTKRDVVVSADVGDAIALFDDLVTAQLPVADRWTDEGGGEYETPDWVEGSTTRKLTVTLTEIAADELGVLVKDALGQTVFDGEIHIVGTAEMKVWVGPRHFCIQFKYEDSGTKYEVAAASMADPEPLPLQAFGTYVVARCARDSSGNLVSGSDLPDYWALRDYAHTAFGNVPVGRLGLMYVAAGQADGRSSGGSQFHYHCDVVMQPTSAAQYGSVGKLTQFAFVSDAHPADAVIEIPVDDDGAVGEFEVLGTVVPGSQYTGRLAVRRSF